MKTDLIVKLTISTNDNVDQMSYEKLIEITNQQLNEYFKVEMADPDKTHLLEFSNNELLLTSEKNMLKMLESSIIFDGFVGFTDHGSIKSLKDKK